MKVSLIAAVDKNYGIGKGNKLPWHIPEDLKYFKKMTTGKPVVMGRKTFESIGFPLPKRKNIVLTRDKTWQADGVEVVHSVDEALQKVGKVDEVMILGGGEIYKLFLDNADRLYLTEVATEVDADAFFPSFDKNTWQEVSRQPNMGEINFDFVVYERR